MTFHASRRLLAAATLWSACGAVGAQAEEPAVLPLQYEPAAREAPPVAHTGTCSVDIAATEDNRQNKLTIGATFRGPLLTGDASPWITDGLLALKEFGFPASRVAAGAPPGGALQVKTSVTRAYTWQVGFKIFGMIALRAQFVNKDGVLQEKFYRAHGDKTNMWGASSEFVTALNYALNNLLRAMAEDLSALCKGQKVDTYTYAGPDLKAAAK